MCARERCTSRYIRMASEIQKYRSTKIFSINGFSNFFKMYFLYFVHLFKCTRNYIITDHFLYIWSKVQIRTIVRDKNQYTTILALVTDFCTYDFTEARIYGFEKYKSTWVQSKKTTDILYYFNHRTYILIWMSRVK